MSDLETGNWRSSPAKGPGCVRGMRRWADTTTPHGRFLVTVFGGMAEFERELSLAGTREGRDAAQALGMKIGRSPKLNPFQQREARRRLAAGEKPRAIVRSYGVHRSTIERLPA